MVKNNLAVLYTLLENELNEQPTMMPTLFHVDTTLDFLSGLTVLPPSTLPPVIGKLSWNPVIKKDSTPDLQGTL